MKTNLAPADVIQGFYLVPILAAFGDAGFLDRWLAGDAVMPEGAVAAACARYLCAKGLLELGSNGFAATEAGRVVFQTYPTAMLHFAYESFIAALPMLLENAEVSTRSRELRRDMRLCAKASGLIEAKTGTLARVAASVDLERYGVVADLGCGDASFLIEICRAQDSVRCVGIDRSEEALDAARVRVKEAGVYDRVELVHLDLIKTEAVLAALVKHDVRLVCASFVLHELAGVDDEPLRMLLRGARERIPRAMFAITELYRLSSEELSTYGDRHFTEFTLLHDLSGQRLLSRQDWQGLAFDAGYHTVDRITHYERPPAGPIAETLFLATSAEYA